MNMTLPVPEREDEETLARARRGDRAAFGSLCERYRQRIWKIAMSVARRRADAEDLTQIAIVKAYQALATFRGDTTFEAWLCRITLNSAHDYQKTAWRRRVLLWGQNRPDDYSSAESAGNAGWPTSHTSESAQAEAEQRELQRRVRAEVARLGERERVPIWLVYFEEFSVAEVARLEGVPESTVRSRIKVGLRKLERTLGDLGLPDNEPQTDVDRAEDRSSTLLSTRSQVKEMKGSPT